MSLNDLIKFISDDKTICMLLDNNGETSPCFWELDTTANKNISDFYFNRCDAKHIKTHKPVSDAIKKSIQYHQYGTCDKDQYKNKYEQRPVMGPGLHETYEGMIAPTNSLKLFEEAIKNTKCFCPSSSPSYSCHEVLILTPARRAEITRLFIPAAYAQDGVENGKIMDTYLHSVLGVTDEEAVLANKICNWERFKNKTGVEAWEMATAKIPEYKHPAFTYLHYISNIVAQKAFVEAMHPDLVFPQLDAADIYTSGVDRIYLYKGRFYVFLKSQIEGCTSLPHLLLKVSQRKLIQST